MNDALSEEELDRLSERISALLETFEGHHDVQVREAVFELLQLIDVLHREALTRILPLVHEADPRFSRLRDDPVVRMVLTLYDLLPGDAGEASGSPPILLPLYEARPQPKWRSSSFIPLDLVRTVKPLRAPQFTSVLALERLDEGSMRGLEVSGERVLLCRLAGEVYAFRNRCPGSALPLDLGRLDGTTIICPWHECRFDARSGRPLDGGERRLEVIPVSTADAQIRLALGVTAGPQQ